MQTKLLVVSYLEVMYITYLLAKTKTTKPHRKLLCHEPHSFLYYV